MGEIARQLGISRNSVLGHVRRMKLPQRGADAVRQLQRHGSAKKKGGGFSLPYQAGQGASHSKVKAKPTVLDTAAVDAPLRLDGNLITLETLHSSRMCKYPIGDVASPGFHFCGNIPKDGTPYCEPHARRCYQPQTGVSNVDKSMLRKSGVLRALG